VLAYYWPVDQHFVREENCFCVDNVSVRAQSCCLRVSQPPLALLLILVKFQFTRILALIALWITLGNGEEKEEEVRREREEEGNKGEKT
jgi:hypothetical protein